ncbi:MAG TPA: oligosaccharide flippase family protein [Actinomycetota bacterium]|nr:oligosaccharide flippase family protein [Actinomycetota bacterium]
MADQPRIRTRFASRLLADGNLTRKASLNAMVAVLDYGARVIVGLVLSPLVLSRLGETMFGAWQFLQSLIGHAGPASGRPGEALKWVIAYQQSSDDHQAKREEVGNAIAVWALFAPLLVAVGGVLGYFAPLWLHVPAASQTIVRIAAALLVSNLVIQGLATMPQSVLYGENLAYKRVGLSTSVVFFGGVMSVLALVLHAGLVGLACATVATTLLSGAMFLHIVRSRVTWFGIARPTRRGVRRFLSISWWFLVWNFVMQVMKAGDIVVLGIAGSASLVANYTLARYIPEAISAVVAILIFAVTPGLGGLVGAGDTRRATDVRHETMSMTWLAALIGGTGVLLWEASFLRLWVGPGHYPGTLSVTLIVVMILQWALIRTDSNIIDVTLRLRWKVLLGVASAALSVGLAWLFVGKYGLGIVGVVLGFIAGRSIQSVAYPIMIGRLLDIPLRRQLNGLVRPGLATVTLLGSAAAVGTVLHAATWPSLVLEAGLSAVVVAAAALFGGISARQRARLLRRARTVLGRA